MSKSTDTGTSDTAAGQVWRTRGFEAFREGTFGNAGENLYVSRAGVLQRIHLFDLNRDGYVDLIFCNSQEHNESPPAYVYSDVLGTPARIELPSAGSPAGAVADISGDGYDDVVLGMEKSGAAGRLNAFIYFGAADGLSERSMLQLPAHKCTSVAAGDFTGNGKIDLAFIIKRKLRIFYQGELGLEAKNFVDLNIKADQIGAFDLDGDGCAELCALDPEAPPRIYWGGPDRISPDRFTELDVGAAGEEVPVDIPEGLSLEEQTGGVFPILNAIDLDGIPHFFLPYRERALLVPVQPDRMYGTPLAFPCREAYAVAAADVNRDGTMDLVFACRDRSGEQECSWIYPGADPESGVAVPTDRACDVAAGDLNGNGYDDVVFCQWRNDTHFSYRSPVFRGGPGGVDPHPTFLATEGARRVFIGRTSDEPLPQVLFVNHRGRDANNKVDSTIYYGGPDGFSPDRKTALNGCAAVISSTCDFSDNGWPDIFIVNSAENALHLDPGSFVFYGGPDGFSYDPDVIVPTNKAWNCRVADIDRDGYLDLIVAKFYERDILIYRGTSDGFDLEHPAIITIPEEEQRWIHTRRMCLGDMNNNGWLDLVVAPTAQERCSILWGGPEGFSPQCRQDLPIGTGTTCAVADLTGNGYLDLVVGSGTPTFGAPHDSWLYIFWNGPEGLRPHRHTELHTQKAIDFAIADFNNNGLPDLFVVSYRSAIDRDIDSYLYWNRPGRGFANRDRMRIRTHSAAACFAADFDEDGYVDLAVANHKTFNDHLGDSFIFQNGPDGLDENRYTRLPTSGPHGMYSNRPQNILDGGNEEYYTSAPFELPVGATVASISWDAELQPKTWVKAQLRFADSREELEKASWHGPEGEGNWFEEGQAVRSLSTSGRWVAYRLALGAVNGGCTPRITEVRVAYN